MRSSRIVSTGMLVLALCLAYGQESAFTQHARKAQAALAANDLNTAVVELNAMLRIDGSNADAHANLGMIDFNRGDFAGAREHFEKALVKAPSLWNAKAFLGMCELRLGNIERGRTLLTESVEKISDPGLQRQARSELEQCCDPEGLYNSYRAHSDAAAAALKRLAAIAPQSAYLHMVLGENYRMQDQFTQAITEFRKAVEIDSNRPGLHYQLGEVLLAAARTEENRALAAKEFAAELAIRPNDGLALTKLAEIAVERHDAVEAKKLFERALAQRPDLVEAQAGLSKLLEEESDLEGAVTHLRAAILLTPEDQTLHYRLARLLRSQKKEAEAESEMKTFRRLAARKSI